MEKLSFERLMMGLEDKARMDDEVLMDKFAFMADIHMMDMEKDAGLAELKEVVKRLAAKASPLMRRLKPAVEKLKNPAVAAGAAGSAGVASGLALSD